MLDTLSNDAKCVLAWLNGPLGPTTLKIGGQGAENRFTSRSQKAMDELIEAGLMSAKPFNKYGRMEYRPTEKAEPLRGKISLSFLEKHGRWPITEKNT